VKKVIKMAFYTRNRGIGVVALVNKQKKKKCGAL
jgi:hypothetical protein